MENYSKSEIGKPDLDISELQVIPWNALGLMCLCSSPYAVQNFTALSFLKRLFSPATQTVLQNIGKS